MFPEPFDSRAKAPPATRWEKGYADKNDDDVEEVSVVRLLFFSLLVLTIFFSGYRWKMTIDLDWKRH